MSLARFLVPLKCFIFLVAAVYLITSLTPTVDETLGIIVEIVSHLLDHTGRILFPIVF